MIISGERKRVVYQSDPDIDLVRDRQYLISFSLQDTFLLRYNNMNMPANTAHPPYTIYPS